MHEKSNNHQILVEEINQRKSPRLSSSPFTSKRIISPSPSKSSRNSFVVCEEIDEIVIGNSISPREHGIEMYGKEDALDREGNKSKLFNTFDDDFLSAYMSSSDCEFSESETSIDNEIGLFSPELKCQVNSFSNADKFYFNNFLNKIS